MASAFLVHTATCPHCGQIDVAVTLDSRKKIHFIHCPRCNRRTNSPKVDDFHNQTTLTAYFPARTVPGKPAEVCAKPKLRQVTLRGDKLDYEPTGKIEYRAVGVRKPPVKPVKKKLHQPTLESFVK